MHKDVIGVEILAILVGLGLHSGAEASKLIIKNDDTATVDVVVEPGDGTVSSSTPQVKQVVEAGKEITLTVTKDELGNMEIFSVKGKVATPSLYNRCSGLFLKNDYKIVFTGAKTGGTVCHAEKMEQRNKKDPGEGHSEKMVERRPGDKDSSTPQEEGRR